MNREINKVCILTGGGDAPGLNPVLRGFVKTASERGISTLGSEDGFEGLIQGRLVELNMGSVRGILPKGGSILGCSNRANPFSYGNDNRDVSSEVIERLTRHEVDALVAVGGDGTMHMAKRFMALGVPTVGIPKTIDNDLGATEFTFGFDTAIKTATWAIDNLHATAEAHDRVMIVELMGRYAGWIALTAGLAGGADVILIPEIPYELDRVVAKIKERAKEGITFSIVVVGEGAHPQGKKASEISDGRPGHLPRLGGAGQLLEEALKSRIDHEVRTTVLGHVQRGGSPSAFDRVLGTRFGVKAAELIADGRTGRMVALRGTSVLSVTIDEALQKPKLVNPDGELVRVARSVGIELGAAAK